MKDNRKKKCFVVRPVPWRIFFWCSIFIVFFSGFTFSTVQLLLKGGFHPRLVSTWRIPPLEVMSGEPFSPPAMLMQETVLFPEHALIILTRPESTPIFTKDDIDCIYLVQNSSEPKLKLYPLTIDEQYSDHQLIRCPLPPRGTIVSVAVKKSPGSLLTGSTYRWDSLAYEALIDRDNTTVVFVKGLNLRGGRVSDASKFKCLYGFGLRKPKFVLREDAVSVAQEIVRCKTPLSILNSQPRFSRSINDSVKVSIRVVGRRTLGSVARPRQRLSEMEPMARKKHGICACTMLRNQARFLREWIMYHAEIGVQHWFIYDNNSDDEIEKVVKFLNGQNYNITRHVWPWIKTQEAGFAHCALRARDSCEWVAFIDVDEFFHLPSNLSLHEIIRNQSSSNEVAELRVSCHSFGPSGLKRVPVKGVTVGYTCRMAAPERHKSIVRPEALNSSLINSVHHFHLQAGLKSVDMNKTALVINHYKYQVWEVFKEKFYRRVATYVSDWQQERNTGSKDRAPGLGTKAVEPPDWSTRFCEVRDTGLRDIILETFSDSRTGLLPWQEQLYERIQ